MNSHEQVAIVRAIQPGAFKHMEQEGYCFTLMCDDEPIGCGGICKMWSGVGEAWVALIAPARRCPLRVVRLCRQGIADIVRRGNFHRIQGAVIESDARALRFAKFMGFQSEGLMAKFDSQGHNFFRIAKIWH